MTDPLHYHAPLPLKAEYFPMGRPLRIATNSPLVHAAAEEVWSRYRRMFESAPHETTLNQPWLQLHIEVDAEDGAAESIAPVLRAQNHLVTMIADSRNFANADLRAGFAFAHFTNDVVADSAAWRYHFLEPLVYLIAGARYFTYLHASSVSWQGRAVVLCGDSGAGKTCLAFACARRGWTFHSGDATGIVRGDERRIAGRPYEIRFRNTARRLFDELHVHPAGLRPNGKYDIEINPLDLGLHAEVEGRASHIAILKRISREAGGGTSIEPLPKERARCHLEQAICFGDETIRAEQRASLAEFLTLPVWQLCYSDLDSAEQTLRELVNEN